MLVVDQGYGLILAMIHSKKREELDLGLHEYHCAMAQWLLTLFSPWKNHKPLVGKVAKLGSRPAVTNTAYITGLPINQIYLQTLSSFFNLTFRKETQSWEKSSTDGWANQNCGSAILSLHWDRYRNNPFLGWPVPFLSYFYIWSLVCCRWWHKKHHYISFCSWAPVTLPLTSISCIRSYRASYGALVSLNPLRWLFQLHLSSCSNTRMWDYCVYWGVYTSKDACTHLLMYEQVWLGVTTG